MTDSVFVQGMDLGGGGLRVGVKDSIDIEGAPTRMACPCFADAPPAQRHAEVVRALLDAGCSIVGKTNMHELAYGVTGINRWTGTPVNPRAPGRVPGGSSSGSAVAVALRLVDFALGTDTGGSIRIPSACCGVYGLKPTYGRVSRAGVHPAFSSLDCVGPFAGDLPMLEWAMQMLDDAFRPEAAPAQATVGWVAVEANPAVAAAARAALEKADIPLRSITLPTLESAFAAAIAVIGGENWQAFGHLIACEALGGDVRARLLTAREITSADVAAAEKVREAFRAEVDEALTQVDALALPTMPDFPLTLAAAADARVALKSTSFVRQFNLSGHPALSIPVAAADGLPVGLQLVGRRGQDAALCALARLIVS
ncbi:MAG: amidase [Steroidobacteraceae bacterium]